MLSINTNLSSLITQRSMKQSTNRLNKAIERMTTGFKINHAKDNAANYSICTNLDTKIGAYQVAEDNCAMGLDMLATANGTLDQIHDKLQRLRDLAVQASNGTYGDQSKQAINSEANALVDEIERLYSTSEYNGISLFNNTSTVGVATASEPATYSLARTVTVDESKRVSNVSFFTSDETYYICDANDLVALQDLINAYGTPGNVTFELTEDIDMQGVSFSGIGNKLYLFEDTFNGNGHVIKNLTIDDTSGNYAGLFGCVLSATIDSVGVVNCNIKGESYVGSLIGFAYGSNTITNCYSTGSVVGSGDYIGGLIGRTNGDDTITNCYSTSSVVGNNLVGGLVGKTYESTITNCYSIGSVVGSGDYVGGLVGYASYSDTITNCYSTGSVVGSNNVGGLIGQVSTNITGSGNYYNEEAYTQAIGNGSFSGVEAKSVAEITAPANLESIGFTEANGWKVVNGQVLLAWQPDSDADAGGGSSDNTTNPGTPDSGDDTSEGTGGADGTTPDLPLFTPAPDTIILQIGTSSNWGSQVGINIKFTLENIDEFRMIGLDTTTDYLTKIDDILLSVSEKQTHLGASSNRLESVLEEIIISRDNLISSRSTLRDADIAEVSSEYIRQQILQQASATLMSTANQSASIALSLI